MRGAVEVSHSHMCSTASSPELAEPLVRSTGCKSPWSAPVWGVPGFVGALTTAHSGMLPFPLQQGHLLSLESGKPQEAGGEGK